MTDPGRVAAIRALEALAARSFPAIEQERRSGWLLRASGGWTGRGNSALPLDVDEADPLTALADVERWYDDRDLPPMVALPVPPFAADARELERRGWRGLHGAVVMTTRCAQLLDEAPPRPDLPLPAVTDAPTDAWLTAYGGPDRDVPPQARVMFDVPGARFLDLTIDGRVVAIVRAVVEGPWVGITAMEVDPEHRRRGLARHLLRCVATDAVAAGADRIWLQVDPANRAGCALYLGAGFRQHHTYRYYQRGPDAREEQ